MRLAIYEHAILLSTPGSTHHMDENKKQVHKAQLVFTVVDKNLGQERMKWRKQLATSFPLASL